MKELLLHLRFLPHAIVVLCRATCGRLYVCRDRPDWVVHMLASMSRRPDDHANVAQAIEDARTERQLRMRRMADLLRSKGAHEAAQQWEQVAHNLLAIARAGDRT